MFDRGSSATLGSHGSLIGHVGMELGGLGNGGGVFWATLHRPTCVSTMHRVYDTIIHVGYWVFYILHISGNEAANWRRDRD